MQPTLRPTPLPQAELDNYYDDVGRYALFASVGAIAINMFIIVTASGPDIQTGTDPLHLVFAVQGIGLTAMLSSLRASDNYADFSASLGWMNLHIDPPKLLMNTIGSSLEIESDEAELFIGNSFYAVGGLCAFSIIHVLWIRFYNWKIRRYVGLLRVVSGPGIHILASPQYPGIEENKHRHIEPGEELYFKKIKMVPHKLVDQRVTWDIAFYQLRDGRGWIHDFQPQDEGVRHIEVLEELTPLNIRPGLRFPQFQYLLVLLMLQGLLQSSMGVLKEGAGLYVFSGAVIVLAFCVGFIIIMAYILRKNFVDLGEALRYEHTAPGANHFDLWAAACKGQSAQLGEWLATLDAAEFVTSHGFLFTDFRRVNLNHFVLLIDAAVKVVLVVLLTMLRGFPQALCAVVFMFLLLTWRLVSVPFVEPKGNRNVVFKALCELLAMLVPALRFVLPSVQSPMANLSILIQLILILFNIVELVWPGVVRIWRFCRMICVATWVAVSKPRFRTTTHEFIMPSADGGAAPIQVRIPRHRKREIDQHIERALIDCADHLKSELETPAGPLAEYQQGFARRAVAWAKDESAALVAGSDYNTPPIGNFHYSGLYAMKDELEKMSSLADGKVEGPSSGDTIMGTAVNEIRQDIIDECAIWMMEYFDGTLHPLIEQEQSVKVNPTHAVVISIAVGLGIRSYLNIMIPELVDHALQEAIDEEHHTPEYLKGNFARKPRPSSVRGRPGSALHREKDSQDMAIEFVTENEPVLWAGSGFETFSGPPAFASAFALMDDAEDDDFEALPEGSGTAVAAEQPEDLKGTPWEQHVDKETRAMFFYNTETEETSWSHPFEKDLPDGWSKHVDPDTGETFYYNAETDETSWTLPEGIEESAIGDDGSLQVEEVADNISLHDGLAVSLDVEAAVKVDEDEFDSLMPPEHGLAYFDAGATPTGRPSSSASPARVVPVIDNSQDSQPEHGEP